MRQAGTALFGAASVGGALASSAGELIAARAAMGIGAALIMPATLSIITNVFPAEERGKAIGIWSGLAGVGIGLGPLIGGVLLRELSWSRIFWLNVPSAPRRSSPAPASSRTAAIRSRARSTSSGRRSPSPR